MNTSNERKDPKPPAKAQSMLFETAPDWAKDWEGMPEYKHEDLRPYQQIILNFECAEDVAEFAKLIDQKLTEKTDTLWFPVKTPEILKNKRWVSES